MNSRTMLALALLLACAGVSAATTGNAVLTWTASTTHTDGTPVVSANMTYHVHVGAKGVSPKTYTLTTAALTATLANQPMTQCFEVYAVEGTVSSIASAEVCMPNTPSPVTVTLKLTP